MSEPPLVDAAVLGDLIEHIGEDAARVIVDLFLGECRDLVAAMESAAGDPDRTSRAAHSLKSSAGQLGAAALAEAAIAVESAAGTDLPQRVAALARCARLTESDLAARFAPR